MNEIDLFIEYLINNNVNINLSLNEDKIIDDINGRLVIINYLPFFLIWNNNQEFLLNGP